MENYYKVILNSSRFKGLSEEWEGNEVTDSGYFADPARQNENSISKVSLPRPQASSDSTDSSNVMKENIQFETEKIPSLWSLIRQKSIGSLAIFYPYFFWRFKPLTVVFVFFNCIRKYGFIFSLKLLTEYVGWKVFKKNEFQEKKSIPQYISLRKILKKKLIPDIESDNLAMEILRKGR
tara:strand:- start:2062 stop:2598 length:537 start_codon:yes stop_codon:yes gene_type:complete